MASRALLVAAILAACCCALRADEPPTVKSRRTDQAPVLDGRLRNDPCWQAPPQIMQFFLLGEEEKKPKQNTYVWIAHDDKALYVAARCYEERMKDLVAVERKRDGEVYEDDCFELFLSPHPGGTRYYHFLVSAAGSVRDDLGSAPEWNADWQGAAYKEVGAWTVEMAIPFDQLELTARTPDAWRINFARQEKPYRELSSWSRMAGGFHQPALFGRLDGIDADLASVISVYLKRRFALVEAEFGKLPDPSGYQPAVAAHQAGSKAVNVAKEAVDKAVNRQEMSKAEDLLDRAQESLRVAIAKAALAEMVRLSGEKAPAYVVCRESPMKKVRPDAPYIGRPTAQIDLSMARNESEPVHLVFVGLRGKLRACRFGVSPLKLKDGRAIIPEDDVRVNVVGCVRTLKASGGALEPPGLLPDPLLPDSEAKVEEGAVQSFWVTVRTRRETRPGVYEGAVIVRAEGLPEKRIPMSVKVHRFALPRTPALRTAFGLNESHVLSRHGVSAGWSWTTDETHYRRDSSGVSVTKENPRSGRFCLSARRSRSRYVHIVAPVSGNGRCRVEFDFSTDAPGRTFVLLGGGGPGGKNAFRELEHYVGPNQWEHAEFDLSECGVAENALCSIQVVHDNRGIGGEHGLRIDNVRIVEKLPDGRERVILNEGFETGAKDPRERREKIIDNYITCLLEHRISPYCPASPTVMTDLEGQAEIDWEEFDERIARYVEMGLGSFNVNWLRLGGGWGSVMTPREQREIGIAINLCRLTQRHLDEKGWADMAYIYVFDEPGAGELGKIRAVFDLVHKNAPKLKTLLTFGYGATRPWHRSMEGRDDAPLAAYAEMEEAVDIWVPHIDCCDWRVLDKLRDRPRAELWNYVCISAMRPYPNVWGIDYPGTDHRVVFWQLFRYRLVGHLYWQTTYWKEDVWTNPMSYPGGNGDGSLVYWPAESTGELGSDGRPDSPVSSVRLELIRDGIEDYDYLHLLSGAVGELDGKSAERARKLMDVSSVCRSYTDFTRDPEAIQEHRRRIGAFLDELIESGQWRPRTR